MRLTIKKILISVFIVAASLVAINILSVLEFYLLFNNFVLGIVLLIFIIGLLIFAGVWASKSDKRRGR